MNNQSFAAGPVVQSERAGKYVDDIWDRVGVPWQDRMWCDGQFDRGELGLPSRIVCVGFAILGLRSL